MKNVGTKSSHVTLASIAVIALLASCSSGTATAPDASSRPENSPSVAVSPSPRVGPYEITYVYDGDTAVAQRAGERLTVRVVGINTPEVSGPHTEEQCFGPEASARGKELLLGKQVWLERDPNQGTKDKYDRDLAFIWINNTQDFGLQMVSGGFAREFTYDKPYPHQAQYKAAQAQARSRELGLWSPTTCAGKR